MKFVKITNNSRWNTDELAPLLRVAWASAKDEFKRPCNKVQPFHLTIGRTRTNIWHCKSGYDSAKVCFADPGNRGATRIGSTETQNMSETIIGVAAWVFASSKGAFLVAQACCRDAVLTYRANQAKIDAEVAAVVQAKKDKAGDAFAAMVFDGLEKSTLDYKLSQIDSKERVWLRKLKLAQTKLKTLRRRRAALIAADKRKKKTSGAQAAASAALPQPQAQV